MKKIYENRPSTLDRNIAITIDAHKLVGVLFIEDTSTIFPLMETLQNAGLKVLELTLRTPVAMEALSIIKKEFPNLLLGVGTVLTTEQLQEVQQRGADFGVSPGFNPNILSQAIKNKFPFFPGIMTPSDIEHALSYGCRLLKFFPAEHAGGLSYLKTINAPYAHLGIKYISLGGISIHNLVSYISSPIIQGVGGSWLAPSKLIQEKNWSQIKQNVEEALALIDNNRKSSHPH